MEFVINIDLLIDPLRGTASMINIVTVELVKLDRAKRNW